ncbi:TIGR03752 family integrating conjugative element protein [Moritella sp. F3]|uniref:TIGR03752 family integrating conjugative element protein n=1 Tax=Moritella sp. F3 TaxID=2718882 RepID=UPI0018E0E6CA|nr:TIGR03752 family integrating conjugative element protein [Moritella sp. F3]GIC77590.1 integrating conjugative element protein [Moritella sp. F1]GIC82003.1 integrating conjugative element protein [Moritella sp. F3]
MNSNPIVTKWVPGIVILILILVAVRVSKGGDTSIIDAESGTVTETVTNVKPTAVDLTEEGDTGSDTLKTLVASMKEMQQNIQEQKDDKATIINENNILRNQLQQEQVERDGMNTRITDLIGKVSNFSENLESIKASGNGEGLDQGVVLEDEYPVDSRYPANITASTSNTRPRLKPPSFSQPESTATLDNYSRKVISGLDSSGITDGYSEWVMPIDAVKTTDEDGKSTITMPEFGEQDEIVSSQTLTAQEKLEDLFSAYATIPRNATLLDSVTLTAMIGRIPLEGKVVDPYKFKVLLSRENLASNGIFIEGIEGAVVSGTARGDYTLKCVSGEINSFLFTFTDGTILSYPEGNEPSAKSLGYISDNKGIPCVSGKLISNAASYLTQSVGLDVLKAGGEAYAAAQTAVTTNGGDTTTSVPGSIGEYAAGKALSNGTNTVTSYLETRQQSAYDAVFVPPNKLVVLHMEEQIDINYIKNGRRTNHYENQFSKNDNYYGLD